MIKFTQNNKIFTIGSIEETAKRLAENITFSVPVSTFSIKTIDFALIDLTDHSDIDIDEILTNAYSWHGIKELEDLGFDTDSRNFIFFYYGGEERMDILSILSSDPLEEIILEIKRLFLKQLGLDSQEVGTDILTEWIRIK